MITVGILVAYFIALVILRAAPGSAGRVDWRLILGLGAVPALIGLVLRSTMPESPRWLMRQGRYEKAAEALRELRDGGRLDRGGQDGGAAHPPRGGSRLSRRGAGRPG